MYFVTAIRDVEFCLCKPTKQCFGYFKTLEEAQELVNSNKHCLNEPSFQFCVIEKLEQGEVGPAAAEEYWFRFNDQERRWVPIDKPKGTSHRKNWAFC